MEKLKSIVKLINKEPAHQLIGSNLKDLQSIVGGNIELIYLPKDILLIINEVGKLKNLDYNFKLVRLDESGLVTHLDNIVGDSFFVAAAEENFTSLSSEQVEYIVKSFSNTYGHLILEKPRH